LQDTFKYLYEINAVLIDFDALENILYKRKIGVEQKYLTFGLLDENIDLEELKIQLVL
jgi:hypothetical protein